MEIYLSLLIPAMAIAIRYYFAHEWKTPLVLILVTIWMPFAFEAGSINSQTSANEVLGGWVKDATYYERWNEYIHKTCTREVGCTTDKKGNRSCRTERYDCSYIKNHPEQWELNTTVGSFDISGGEFNRLKSKFGNNKFINMNRDYHSLDGDAYVTTWSGDSSSFEGYFINHTYENRIQASQSIFNYKDVDTTIYKVFSRISASKGAVSSYLVEGKGTSKSGNDIINYYNGLLGSSKQLRIIVLVFVNRPLDYGIKQESHWKGGNKNEFVTAIGIDNVGKINWAHPFSWTQNKELISRIRDGVMDIGAYNETTIASYVGSTVSSGFIRKQFKDFDYIDVRATPSAVFWCWTLITVITMVWVFLARHTDEAFS